MSKPGTPIALTIAGSDSGGGAGIQADLKAMSALGAYGASVITAITAQNTQAVTAVQGIELTVIAAQIDAVLSDLSVNAVKIGMLATPEIIETVAQGLKGFKGPIVLDPVMVAKSGDALLAEEAIAALREQLIPMATVLTPNLPEAAKILGVSEVQEIEALAEQGKALSALGPRFVLMKGGHMKGEICTDLLFDQNAEVLRLSAQRLPTKNTHGTGCTLSASIAALLAQGHGVESAVTKAHAYLQEAIKQADSLQIGQGHGPVHHFHAQWSQL